MSPSPRPSDVAALSAERSGRLGRTGPIVVVALLALVAWRVLALQHAGLSLHFDEAQYWVWSTRPDWGYYSKPPVVAWLYAFVHAVAGDDPPGVRILAGLIYTAATGFVGLAARDAFGARTGALAALAFATIPGVAISAGFLTTDAPLVLAWSAAWFALQRALGPDGRIAHWIGVGVAVGAGLMSKYTMGAFAISTAALLLADPAARMHLRRPGPWLAGAIAAMLFAPNLAWNAANGFPTLQHTHEISQVDHAGLHPGRLVEFVAGQFVVFGPLLTLAGGMAWRRRRAASRDRVGPRDVTERTAFARLAWFAAPLLVIACAQATIARAHVNWALPAFVTLTIAAVAAIERVGLRRLLAAAIALNLGLAALVMHWPVIRDLAGIEAGARRDLFNRFHGWPAFAARIAARIPAGPPVVLVNEERRATALLAYELRIPLERIATWNPEGGRNDHWERFADLAEVARRLSADTRFLVVGVDIDEASLRASFDTVTPLGDDPGPGCAACAPRWRLWEVRGFRGYAAGTVQGSR